MCGRFTQQRPSSELADIFEAEDLVDAAGGRFNVAPTDPAAVVVQRDDRRALTAFRWGLIPHWSESPATGNKMFNARAESIDRTPAFRYAFQKRRCLVPVDAFYEWQRATDARGKVVREPYLIARRDGEPMALAGLWAGWHDDDTGEVIRSFTVITTGPNDLVRPIHDRMPVVIPESAWDRWLDPTATDAPALAELKGLLVPADENWLEAYRVSRRVNDVRNDDPGLVEPLDAAEDGPRQLSLTEATHDPVEPPREARAAPREAREAPRGKRKRPREAAREEPLDGPDERPARSTARRR